MANSEKAKKAPKGEEAVLAPDEEIAGEHVPTEAITAERAGKADLVKIPVAKSKTLTASGLLGIIKSSVDEVAGALADPKDPRKGEAPRLVVMGRVAWHVWTRDGEALGKLQVSKAIITKAQITPSLQVQYCPSLEEYLLIC